MNDSATAPIVGRIGGGPSPGVWCFFGFDSSLITPITHWRAGIVEKLRGLFGDRSSSFTVGPEPVPFAISSVFFFVFSVFLLHFGYRWRFLFLFFCFFRSFFLACPRTRRRNGTGKEIGNETFVTATNGRRRWFSSKMAPPIRSPFRSESESDRIIIVFAFFLLCLFCLFPFFSACVCVSVFFWRVGFLTFFSVSFLFLFFDFGFLIWLHLFIHLLFLFRPSLSHHWSFISFPWHERRRPFKLHSKDDRINQTAGSRSATCPKLGKTFFNSIKLGKIRWNWFLAWWNAVGWSIDRNDGTKFKEKPKKTR